MVYGFICFAALGICVKAYGYFGTHIRGNDGQLYYMQLRSFVVDGDLDIRNDRELTPKKNVFQRNGKFTHPQTLKNGRLANKYTFGWAATSLPVYSVIHLVVGGDGFSEPYDLGMALWHCGLAMLAIFLLGFTLAKRTSPDAAAIGIAGLFFATNLIYYTSIYPMMNHAASVAVIAMLLCLAIQCYENPKQLWSWIVTPPLFFLLVLLRPTDLVIGAIFLPALWSMVKEKDYIRLTGLLCMMSVGVMLAIGVQLIAWRMSYGYWIINTYTSPSDGFDWFMPHLLSITFSDLHGGWRFHPYLMLGVIATSYAIWKSEPKQRKFFIGVLAAVLIHLYVYAAFRNWSAGHSFGNRFLLNAAPLALPAVVYLFHRYGKAYKISNICVIGVLVVINILFLLASLKGGALGPDKAIPLDVFFKGLI